MACPIWPGHQDHEAATQNLAPAPGGGYRAAHIVSCPVCGNFEITYQAAVAMKDASEEQRFRVTWATRAASEAEAPLVLYTDDLTRLTESVAEPRTPIQKAQLLILLLGSGTRSLGERASFNAATDWPLVYARGPQELVLLLGSLKQRGLVEYPISLNEGVGLTFDGWERFQSLLSTQAPTSTHAFVAMWFDPSMEPVYDDAIQPALYDIGYDPIRVDREHFLGKIDDYIVASIRKSSIVVADFTGHRHGVYWEAGFGYGLGLPVIYTCREDEISNAHFDTRQYNHLAWKTPEDLKKGLRARIEATITNRPKLRKPA